MRYQEGQAYEDDRGNTVFVSCGIGGGHDWMSVRQGSTGGTHRIKTKFLPLRSRAEEAQADLDSYAKKKKWKASSSYN